MSPGGSSHGGRSGRVPEIYSRSDRSVAIQAPEGPLPRPPTAYAAAVLAGGTMATRTIRQTVTLPGSPDDVYEALMTTRGHRAFTGAAARISGKVGGKFSVWDGYIHGENVELVPGKLIVQRWRPTEADWPEAYYSTVRFELSKVPKGTRVVFTHSGVLAQHAGHLAAGWKDHYWNLLKEFLATD